MIKNNTSICIFLVFLFIFSLNFVVAEWDESLNEGLISVYNFDEGNGIVSSETLYGENNFTLYNGLGWTDGKVGNATGVYDRVDDFAILQNKDISGFPYNNTADYTICIGINLISLSGEQHFLSTEISPNNGFAMLMYSSRLYIEWDSVQIYTSSTVFTEDQWELYCLSSEGTGNTSQVHIYVNGAEESWSGSTGITIPDMTDGTNLTLGMGRDYGNVYDPAEGEIDHFYIWNRNLSSSEINDFYNNGSWLSYVASSQNETSTNQSGFWNLTGTYLSPSSIDYKILIRDNLQLGTQDAFGRNQIWNFLPASILRLGSLGADGDTQTIASQGIVIYGNNSRDDAMSSSDFGFARIKPNRIALHNGINGTQGDYFRMDPDGLYLKNDSFVKTFEITRESGLVNTEIGYSVNSQAGITNNSNFWMCKDSTCSTTCQVDIKGGIIVGCI